MSQFKEKQVVRVKYIINGQEPDHWVTSMIRLRRSLVTIRKINDDRYYLVDIPGYVWYESDFEKANTNAGI